MTDAPCTYISNITLYWRALTHMLIAYTRFVCRRDLRGASGVLEQVDQLEITARTMQVMVCHQLAQLQGTDEASQKAREQLGAIAATLLCLTVFLVSVRMRLRGGPTGRGAAADARLAPGLPFSGYRFAQLALHLTPNGYLNSS